MRLAGLIGVPWAILSLILLPFAILAQRGVYRSNCISRDIVKVIGAVLASMTAGSALLASYHKQLPGHPTGIVVEQHVRLYK